MKRPCALTLILTLLLLGACDTPEASREETATNNDASNKAANAGASRVKSLRERFETPRTDDVMVVAHRSCWKAWPENSIAAMRRCIELGVDMIEVDVRQSVDGALVIIHDETVDRTTNGAGRVDEMTLSELKDLKLRQGAGGPDSPLTDHRIPTLAEVLDAVEGKILVNLDTKGEVLKATMTAVAQRGLADQVIFKSSLPPESPELRALDLPPGSYFMPIIREPHGTLKDQVEDFAWARPEAFEVLFHSREFFEQNADAVTGAGVRLWVNTLWAGMADDVTDARALKDPDANWGYLLGHGVSMIQTDEPEALIRYVESRKSRE